LIQALYMTPELRAGLFDLSLDDLQVVTTAPAAVSPDVAATPASPTEEEPQQEQRTDADADTEEEVKAKEAVVVEEPTKKLPETEVQPVASDATEHANVRTQPTHVLRTVDVHGLTTRDHRTTRQRRTTARQLLLATVVETTTILAPSWRQWASRGRSWDGP
jgi:hypothetical protein